MATSQHTTDTMNFADADAMPAITWHWLRMNETEIEIPEGFSIDPQVVTEAPFLSHGADDEFENAMADAQEVWEATHPEPSDEEKASLEKARAAEADATYGGTALSAYQEKADEIEDQRSLMASFSNGTGEDVSAYLRYAGGKRVVVQAGEGETVDARVMVSAKPKTLSVAAIDVIADKNAIINLSVLINANTAEEFSRAEMADEATDETAQLARCEAICGTTIRGFADVGARLNIVRTQVAPEGVSDIDDMGFFAADSAHIDVRQTVLGASRSYTGLACDLRGDESSIDIDTRYLGRASEERDFNYIVRHHGLNTESNMGANGVLAGKCKKTLRGTIDFIRGCCGSVGSENETVLLVDEDVRNKTVPTLLCNEDDVMGNHGATIGHIRDEQLFYLMCRGLSQAEAERMFASAMIEQAALTAPDTDVRDAVIAYGSSIDSAFASLFDEEA